MVNSTLPKVITANTTAGPTSGWVDAQSLRMGKRETRKGRDVKRISKEDLTVEKASPNPYQENDSDGHMNLLGVYAPATTILQATSTPIHRHRTTTVLEIR
eukprot:CAMPEP_0170175944 /NCGR_PEP_ID=MMETSP0040_2-20121228/8923_1 /TAXON_ID=641309 /ORGANISM="Lotharella oceanica, Strain CCMP622" /LENGTH=100 /DNA_ID=CAMNT_0010418103 /DNA_START=504 /DNA_END=803 /DNA_ORIENTATION=+